MLLKYCITEETATCFVEKISKAILKEYTRYVVNYKKTCNENTNYILAS